MYSSFFLTRILIFFSPIEYTSNDDDFISQVSLHSEILIENIYIYFLIFNTCILSTARAFLTCQWKLYTNHVT